MKLLELFSGIGGFALGLHKAGVEFDKHYFSEIDKHAIANYKYNFKNAESIGTVTNVCSSGIERPDIITFGFPCQDLSIAGKRKGFDGERSSLFFSAMEIIDKFKPDTFIFENVKGLFSSNRGKDFTAVLRTIADIGLYECEWQLVNTRWVLPQNRERVYFIGHLTGRSQPRVFPFRENDFVVRKSQSKINVKLQHLFNTGNNSQGERVYDTNGLYSSLGVRQQGANKIFTDNNIRYLTEIECERLQGFPDNWTQYGNYDGEIKKISKTQRYKMLGNAVTVDIVKLIAERLFSQTDAKTGRDSCVKQL